MGLSQISEDSRTSNLLQLLLLVNFVISNLFVIQLSHFSFMQWASEILRCTLRMKGLKMIPKRCKCDFILSLLLSFIIGYTQVIALSLSLKRACACNVCNFPCGISFVATELREIKDNVIQGPLSILFWFKQNYKTINLILIHPLLRKFQISLSCGFQDRPILSYIIILIDSLRFFLEDLIIRTLAQIYSDYKNRIDKKILCAFYTAEGILYQLKRVLLLLVQILRRFFLSNPFILCNLMQHWMRLYVASISIQSFF